MRRRRRQLADFREFFPCGVFGHRAQRIDAATIRTLRLPFDEFGRAAGVDYRVGFRHDADRCESTRHGGGATRFDRLVLFEARLAEHHPAIDQTRRDDAAGSVESLIGFLTSASRRRDSAVDDPQIGDFVTPGGGIDDASAADKKCGHGT
jgi:hypothetical protein